MGTDMKSIEGEPMCVLGCLTDGPELKSLQDHDGVMGFASAFADMYSQMAGRGGGDD